MEGALLSAMAFSMVVDESVRLRAPPPFLLLRAFPSILDTENRDDMGGCGWVLDGWESFGV